MANESPSSKISSPPEENVLPSYTRSIELYHASGEDAVTVVEELIQSLVAHLDSNKQGIMVQTKTWLTMKKVTYIESVITATTAGTRQTITITIGTPPK